MAKRSCRSRLDEFQALLRLLAGDPLVIRSQARHAMQIASRTIPVAFRA
jgi:hypothetical protein